MADSRLDGLRALNEGRKLQALHAFEDYQRECGSCKEALFLCGRALMELERPESALKVWLQALERDSLYLPARQHLVMAYERLGRFGEAAQTLSLLLELPEGVSPQNALQERRALNLERVKIQNYSSGNEQAIRFSDRINSEWDEYMPFILMDESVIGFTSNRGGGQDKQGRGYLYSEDFWLCDREGPFSASSWTKAQAAPPPLNTSGSEGSASLSADGRTIVFSACGRPDSFGDCDLYMSHLEEGSWSQSIQLPETVNGPWWDSQPSLSADGRLLIFSSNRPGGMGLCDLWISRKDDAGTFQAAENMGSEINTSGNEQGPFLHADGRSLYFSSDGHPGLGAMDLFLSRSADPAELKHWDKPRNLGPPINTMEADLRLVMAGLGERAIFASRRGEESSLDLYYTQMPSCCPPDPSFLLTGQVFSAVSGEPLAARLRLESLQGSSPSWQEARCHKDGFFAMPVPEGEFLLFVTHPEHIFASWMIEAGLEPQPPDLVARRWSVSAANDTLKVLLQPLEIGKITAIENLEFDFNRAEIRPNGLPTLNQVLEMLEGNPGLSIELRGHTDDQGDEGYNLELSRQRANAVRQWLLEAGIDSSRIRARGFGKGLPLVNGQDSNSRARNRRTEFMINDF